MAADRAGEIKPHNTIRLFRASLRALPNLGVNKNIHPQTETNTDCSMYDQKINILMINISSYLSFSFPMCSYRVVKDCPIWVGVRGPSARPPPYVAPHDPFITPHDPFIT